MDSCGTNDRRTLLNRSVLFVSLTLITACTIQPRAHALTRTGRVGDLNFSIYAPDWTWQKRDINILAILENAGDEDTEVVLNLVFPPGKEDPFAYDGERQATLTVPSAETVRYAFTNILSLDGVPRQVYDFELTVRCAGHEAHVAYPVRTIRGAVVNPGKWALVLPGGIALAWCIVFAAVVRRFAQPRAWLVPGAPVSEPDKAESWMNLEPK